MNENVMGTPMFNGGWTGPGYMQSPTRTGMPQQFQMPTEQKGITTIAPVTGEDNAKNYPVAAGQTALLIWFSAPNKGKFWLKTTDIYGRELPMLEFDFNQIAQQVAGGNADQETVSKKDFEELKSMFTSLYNELHN